MMIRVRFFRTAVLIWMLLCAACKTNPPIAQQTVIASPQPSPTATSTVPQQSKDEEKSAEDFFTKEHKLFYNGYEVYKFGKKITYRNSDGKSELMDVVSVVVKKSQKTLATFDGDTHPFGNSIDFGLFSFLGNKGNQLIVSISVPRGGRQWIADLSGVYRVIFDTGKWRIGREGADLSFIDIDKDGILEITAGDFWYYVFNEISISETPVVNVIFRYDPKAKEYVPANPAFPEYSLRWVDDWSKSLPANEGYGYLGRRVDVLLLYLYAGKEKEGWDFFDRVYEAKDKTQVKAKIKNALKHSLVYQYIRNHSKN